MPRRRLLPLLACALLACGGSGPAPAPDDGGAPGGEGGGGSGGEGGGGDGFAAQTHVTVERLDASPECDGLLPSSIPALVTASRSTAPGTECLGGTSDGTGHVVLGSAAGDFTSWHAFSPSGAPLGQFGGEGLRELAPGPEGFSGALDERDTSGRRRVLHASFASDGSPRGSIPVSADPAEAVAGLPRLAREPLGGATIAVGETSILGNHWSSVAVQRFGANGAASSGRIRAGDVSGPNVDFLVAGVSTRGDALVLWREVGGWMERAWISREGTVRDEVAADEASWHDGLPSIGYPSGPHNLRLEPLLDGSLALQVEGQWAWTIPHLGAHRDAPEWLRARPGTTVRFTRGNRGYAVMPAPRATSATCAQRVEVLAPSGKVCGALTFTEPGGACTTGRIDQGWDGTVVQQSTRDRCDVRGCRCTVRFWPRLLAAP